MGPRLDRRGNARELAAKTPFDVASMGPRLDRRGNASSGQVAGSLARAMGPRLDRRGNLRDQVPFSLVPAGFNGATPG